MSARDRAFLASIGVTPRIDPASGAEVVDIEEVIAALGLEGEDAHAARENAMAMGAAPVKSGPSQ